MSFQGWLLHLQSALIPGGRRRHQRQKASLRTTGPHLEVLEDRRTLSLAPLGLSYEQPPTVLFRQLDAPQPPLLADFTSDGILDQLSSEWSELVVRPGRGDGTFGQAIRTAIFPAWAPPSLAVADFNNDGGLDVFTWDYDYQDTLIIANALLGGGNGQFSLWETMQFTSGIDPRMFGTGDVDSNGLADVVIAGPDAFSGDWAYFLLLNDGNWGSSEPPPPTAPHLTINSLIVFEDGPVLATFSVNLTVAGSETITVDYATADGTATSGSDYQPTSGTLTFAPGEMSKTVTVPVNGDELIEPDETFVVNLSNPNGATIASGQGIGTIRNDDFLPSLNISDVFKSEGRSGTTAFTFTVRLSAPSSVPVTVQYATADGTATVAGRDYYAKSGTLTFQPGQISKTVTVSVRGDRTREADETFFLNLANSQGATIGDGQGIGMIENDDGAGWAALINDLALSQTSRKRR